MGEKNPYIYAHNIKCTKTIFSSSTFYKNEFFLQEKNINFLTIPYIKETVIAVSDPLRVNSKNLIPQGFCALSARPRDVNWSLENFRNKHFCRLLMASSLSHQLYT